MMTWLRDHLPKIAAQLASRPGHNEVGADVSDILRYGFRAELGDIDHEVRMPEISGRAERQHATPSTARRPAGISTAPRA